MKVITFVGLLIFFVALALNVEPALAGPGGKIAKAAVETFWGRVALGALAIIFLPLLTYIFFKEKMAERRAYADLRFMASHSAKFEWLKIRERVKESFYKVHSGWEAEDLSTTVNWMTDWYWQNQQLAHLEKWKKQNLVNICNVKKITGIRPILFVHRNHGSEHEDSMLVISIKAKMNDYLQHRENGKVVEGSKKIRVIETLWSFTLENGIWKVSDIEEGNMSLGYAKAARHLPAIEKTIVSDLRA
jgi:hypothetical protein